MIKKDLYNIRFAIIPLIIYCIIMQIVFGTVCPLKAFTGISCPACGLTRATIHLVTGNFKEAMLLNPTVFLWLTIIVLFVIDRYIYKLKIKIFPHCFIIVALITIFWYFINIFM